MPRAVLVHTKHHDFHGLQAAASAARRRAAGLAVDSMFADDAEDEEAAAAVDPAELAEARHRAELVKELKVRFLRNLISMW